MKMTTCPERRNGLATAEEGKKQARSPARPRPSPPIPAPAEQDRSLSSERIEVQRQCRSLPSKQLFIKVDVIIAVYNAESTLEETVGSAMDQMIPDHLTATFSLGEDGASSNKYAGIHFNISICCYNDASTDKSLEILESLEKERTWSYPSSKTTAGRETCNATMQIKLLIGTAPTGTKSQGAGYARNQAVKLRESNDANRNGDKQRHSPEYAAHFLCILDSDDIMHPTRIAEQSHAMLSLPKEQRESTLMGCQFDRIPNNSTKHYAQWANSLSDERLYLEQFRECTLLQPTWFLSKTWFEQLGGYLEATSSNLNVPDLPKRTKMDPDIKQPNNENEVAIGSDTANKQFYQLFHPSEVPDSTINSKSEDRKKRKIGTTNQEKTAPMTLRLAEDSRFFYAHLNAGGRLHLHRTSSPLLSYRHRSGMSQSSNTPRKLLLKLRARAWEDLVFYGNANGSYSNGARSNNNTIWATGFGIWGAGRDGKDFLKALSSEVASKVVCFVDVDQKKIEKVRWYDNPAILGGKRIPILHFSVLAKNTISEQVIAAFGHIEKKCFGDEFNIVSNNREQTYQDDKRETEPFLLKSNKKQKMSDDSIDPEVLRKLPVVVCVAMYRTNGALESNVASIGRVEGKDLWHII